MKQSNLTQSRSRGFTLVELLVVIGIIAVLISMLLPALTTARRQSQNVACRANLKQCHYFMVMYSNDNRGVLFPPDLRSNQPPEKRWPVYVFTPHVWNPPVLTCPADESPSFEHSYVLNDYVHLRDVRFGATRGKSASEIILLGEKKTDISDYVMDVGDFERVVELYRHGFVLGSNYLFVDGHVDSETPAMAKDALDPWDPGKNPVAAGN